MSMIALNLVVLRAREPERLAHFYAGLGLRFEEEQHGAGPRHHACDLGGAVLEIYPLEKDADTTTGTRIGFTVDHVEDVVRQVETTAILTPPRVTRWGKRAVLLDPEGHRVELVERAC